LITNRQFREFVKAKGHVTLAELPRLSGRIAAHALRGLVGVPTARISRRTARQVASPLIGVDRRHPYWPESSIDGLDDHPVIHAYFIDVLAYVTWANRRLPTEAEYEYAACNGLDGAEFARGDELTPDGRHMANTRQGAFPHQNRAEDDCERTSTVTAFPPNQ
jgi:formylglycine-generating enzyme